MRVPHGLTYTSFIQDIMDLQSSINETGKKLSTGREVNRPSDDPIKAKSILASRVELGTLSQYGNNISSAVAYLAMAEESMATAKNLISRVQEVAVSQATGTATVASRVQAATEVGNLFDELVAAGNTMFQGKYVFSGYLITTAAFDSAGAYQGDANRAAVKIGPSSTISIGVNGGEVFSGSSGGVDVFQMVSDLITALGSNDTASIQAAVGTLDTAFDQIGDAMADLGGKVNRLKSSESVITKLRHETEIIISGLEDADLAEVISEFQLKQNALQAAMTSAGRVFGVNIFDYL